ncbi:MAG: NifB/NifX family molybdenum-iron cluster-binding protein [Candidatus Nanopelagicales bacterium]
MILAVPVGPDDVVGHSFGKATSVAVARVEDGTIAGWEAFEVGWHVTHDSGTHGSHHARIVRFLRDHGVDCVVARHVGPPMQRTLDSMGVRLVLGADGDARAAVVAAAAGAVASGD